MNAVRLVAGALLLFANLQWMAPPLLGKEKKPVAKGIEVATVAAYEKLGFHYGGWVDDEWGLTFRRGAEHAERGIPGFSLSNWRMTPLPEVAGPFGFHAMGLTDKGLGLLALHKNLTVLEVHDVSDAGMKH